ncbi:MAG: hypothetical protein ACD_10C00330G0002 [uncultured bacterium]|nr:MAG: hypothetical protein ACD_10C00330G0002 [uncultured bacterium]
MLATKLYRRGTKSILGEYASHRTTGIERHQGQITAIFLTNFSFSNPEANTCHGKNLIGRRRNVINGHFMIRDRVVSS